MKTAGEVINYLNETGANVYEVSEQLGLGTSTLRTRLIRLGFKEQEGKWGYTGDSDKEPKDIDVVSKKRMTTAKKISTVTRESNISKDHSIHEALMQLNLTNKAAVRTTVTLQSDYIEEMKVLATKTRLRLSDLYTLAIHELLNKYRAN
ncbi:ribbon-helix-helix domain-containing protein [Sporosarcina sp. 179-K 8C2 HS]|uniref:ribbon-helix-helix domain-containing protein n=1 Tax=Sporosarcina sp. 179-K 8C2 HS TaxID=3142387 RepID=UPI0039A39C8F